MPTLAQLPPIVAPAGTDFVAVSQGDLGPVAIRDLGALVAPERSGRAYFGIRGNGSADDTSRLQDCIDWTNQTGGIVKLDAGQIIAAGNLVVRPHMRFRGVAPTAATSGGYAQYGTQIWGTGGGAALLGSLPNVANFGIHLENLSLAAAPGSSYARTLHVTGMANSRVRGCNIANNGAGDAVALENENPGTAIGPYPAVWTNWITECEFDAAAGQPLLCGLTDSWLIGNYLSGGAGSREAGLNNRWIGTMLDNWAAGAVGLTVQPGSNTPGAFFVFSGGSFQNASFGGGAALKFVPGPTGVPQPQRALVTGTTFNNLASSTADVVIADSTHVTLASNGFHSASPASILCTGTTDYVMLSGEAPNGSVTLLGANSGRVDNSVLQSKGIVLNINGNPYPVSLGAPDSGGSGFRLLRIGN